MSSRPGAGRVVSVLVASAATMALLSACGGGGKKAATSSPTTSPAATSPSTTTTTVPAKHAPVCPLTGTPPPAGKVPKRPALAIKVENLAQARPQYGLDHADIVFEEPVEGGITRFIAVYQCHQADRVEPVRSGRLVDLDLLKPLGPTLFGYAGAIDVVVQRVRSSGWLEDVGAFSFAADDYSRDPAREEPHNLYTSTALLWAAGASVHFSTKPPKPLFKYGRRPAGGSAANALNINFPLDVTSWTWSPTKKAWMRSYSDTGPAMQGDGAQLSAKNVVVLHVAEYPTPYVEDETGAHENELTLVGKGQAWLARDGTVFRCTWSRASLSDDTVLIGPHHERLTLTPGNTWVELVPTSSTVNVSP